MAELRPRQDVPAGMRKLPTRRPERAGSETVELRSEPAATTEHRPDDVPFRPAGGRRPAAKIEPLAPARYQVRFTATP